MTVKHDHAFCDGGCGAIVHIMLPTFDEWERIPMESGGESHLCQRCRHKRDRGWLSHGLVLECIRCGRTSVDNPEIRQWWGTREQEGSSVCDDCHDSDWDATII